MTSQKCRILLCITTMAFLSTSLQLAAAQVSGTGTAGTVPKWTGSTTLGNSEIVDNGKAVGINVATPGAALTVVGHSGSGSFGGQAGFSAAGGNGGNVPLGNFGTAAAGGGLIMTGGTGGSACSASGGAGGQISITGGLGATSIPASVRCGCLAGASGTVVLGPKVGIGASPAHTLEVRTGGTTLADAWTTRSSRRFKTSIQPLQGALEKIEQLQGVAYQRKDSGKHEIGLLAEDVARVVPEIVARNPNTNEVEGVDYSRITALLIEAVKQQQVQIKKLKSQLRKVNSQLRAQRPKAVSLTLARLK